MDILQAAETFCQHHGKDGYAPYDGNDARKRRRTVLPALALGALSAYLSWGMSKGHAPAMRVLGSVLAFLFGGLYLLYYVLFGMWCKK
jgi:hypothetical protein